MCARSSSRVPLICPGTPCPWSGRVSPYERDPFDDRPRRIALAVEQSRVERQLVRPFVGQRLDVLVTRPLLVQGDVAKIEKHQPVLEPSSKIPTYTPTRRWRTCGQTRGTDVHQEK